jgi:hypothetical protein
METAASWVGGVGGDTATTGQWVRVNPNGTAAQPEDDHTPSGTMAWITGQNATGDLGGGDVDGGFTTLLTPTFDLGAMENPVISYWRWYSNDQGGNPNEDVFRVDITFNGSSWTNVETVGPAGPGTSGGWIFHSFNVKDFGTPSSQVRLRFVAADLGGGSIVEAAVDDFDVHELECTAACFASNYCTANANSSGQAASIDYTGSLDIPSNTFGLVANGCATNQFGIFFYGPSQLNVPFGNGRLCVGGGQKRLPLSQTNSLGVATRSIDFNNLPNGGDINPGDQTNFQFWFRDPMGGGSNFNTSDALNVQFCP